MFLLFKNHSLRRKGVMVSDFKLDSNAIGKTCLSVEYRDYFNLDDLCVKENLYTRLCNRSKEWEKFAKKYKEYICEYDTGDIKVYTDEKIKFWIILSSLPMRKATDEDFGIYRNKENPSQHFSENNKLK